MHTGTMQEHAYIYTYICIHAYRQCDVGLTLTMQARKHNTGRHTCREELPSGTVSDAFPEARGERSKSTRSKRL